MYQSVKAKAPGGREKCEEGWFVRCRDDGTGFISCPWRRGWLEGSDVSVFAPQRRQWRWKSGTLREGEGWAVIGASRGHALQTLRELRSGA